MSGSWDSKWQIKLGPHDYLVLIKAYLQVVQRHMEEEIDEDFWITDNEVYNNDPNYRLRRRNFDIRSTYAMFAKACRRYQ